MKAQEIHNMTNEELAKKLGDLKEELFNLRFRHATGQLENPNVLNTVKKDIEADIEEEFRISLIGIKKLPNTSKFGVFLAFKYYISLFNKIKRLSAQRILNERIRINNSRKVSLMMSSYVQYKVNL